MFTEYVWVGRTIIPVEGFSPEVCVGSAAIPCRMICVVQGIGIFTENLGDISDVSVGDLLCTVPSPIEYGYEFIGSLVTDIFVIGQGASERIGSGPQVAVYLAGCLYWRGSRIRTGISSLIRSVVRVVFRAAHQ